MFAAICVVRCVCGVAAGSSAGALGAVSWAAVWLSTAGALGAGCAVVAAAGVGRATRGVLGAGWAACGAAGAGWGATGAAGAGWGATGAAGAGRAACGAAAGSPVSRGADDAVLSGVAGLVLFARSGPVGRTRLSKSLASSGATSGPAGPLVGAESAGTGLCEVCGPLSGGAASRRCSAPGRPVASGRPAASARGEARLASLSCAAKSAPPVGSGRGFCIPSRCGAAGEVSSGTTGSRAGRLGITVCCPRRRPGSGKRRRCWRARQLWPVPSRPAPCPPSCGSCAP